MGALQYKLRSLLYYTLLLTVGFFATLIGVVATLCGRRFDTNYYVARTFWHVAGPIVGWKFEVEGEEHLTAASNGEEPAVIIGNHQNAVDILYLGRIFPKHASIMAKKELKWVPGLGWFMMLSGSIFINRGNNKSAVGMMQAAAQEMKRKKISLFIFPEGTRHLSDKPELAPFKKGAFHLAVQAGSPIVPIVVENYSKLLKTGKYFKRGTLKIRVLPPIPTTGLTTNDVNDLVERTRSAMSEALVAISNDMPPVPATTDSTRLTVDSPQQSYNSIPKEDTEHAEHENEVEATVGGAAAVDEDATLRASTSTDGKDAADKVVDEATVEVVAPITNDDNTNRKLSIAMVCDFFHPQVGGVEGHIYSLSVELMRRGHKVIVVTHHRDERRGIRYLAPGLKVYHIPYVSIASSATLPNYLLFLPYIRTILIRESVDIVHGHATLSSMAHEAIHHAPLLGVRTVFTDHSLFGFSDAVGVLTNKLLASVLRNVDAVICVSNTGRENTSLRAEIEAERVNVIPNALVPSQFQPDPSRASKEITIVVISRLVYRKGIDLLIASAPTICDLFPEVKFIVAGDGPKMVDLLQMREKYELEDRIEFVGAVRPTDVRDVLTSGHIYLSTSLTEAFGTAIIEAACAGLLVVASRVGGVPEILPTEMIEFAHADEDDVVRALSTAIKTVKAGKHDPLKAHARIRDMYSWAQVAERTETVYERVMSTPERGEGERLARLLGLGPVMGLIMCFIRGVEWWFFVVVCWFWPADEIDVVPAGWDASSFGKAVEQEKQSKDFSQPRD